MHQPFTPRYLKALLLHLLMVAVVTFTILGNCFYTMELQMIRWEQKAVIKHLPEHPTCVVVLEMSDTAFQQVPMVRADECVIGGDFFDIVSIVRASKTVVLTLLPDPKETRLQKSSTQNMTAKVPAGRRKLLPMPGFLFFEKNGIPQDALMAIDRVVPRSSCWVVIAFWLPREAPPPWNARPALS